MAEQGTDGQEVKPVETGEVQTGEQAATETVVEGATEKESPEGAGTDAATATAEVATKEEAVKEQEKKDLTDPGVKRELARMRHDLRQAKEREAFWRGKAEGIAEVAKPKAPEVYTVPMPKQNQDEPYEDFVLRLSDWNWDRKEWQKAKTTPAQPVVSEAEKRIETSVAHQRAEGEKKYEDFKEVVRNVDMPIPVFNEVMESDIGHDIAYYFGQNPEELDRISALPMNKMIREVGKLEDKLRAMPATTKPITKAPAPPPQLKGAGATPPDRIYTDENMSAAERVSANLAKKGLR